MGIKTSTAGVVPAANHAAAAKSGGRDVATLQREALIKCDEAVVALRALLADMQTGDANITTIQNQITALS